jgi:hypothetical protein
LESYGFGSEERYIWQGSSPAGAVFNFQKIKILEMLRNLRSILKFVTGRWDHSFIMSKKVCEHWCKKISDGLRNRTPGMSKKRRKILVKYYQDMSWQAYKQLEDEWVSNTNKLLQETVDKLGEIDKSVKVKEAGWKAKHPEMGEEVSGEELNRVINRECDHQFVNEEASGKQKVEKEESYDGDFDGEIPEREIKSYIWRHKGRNPRVSPRLHSRSDEFS